MENKLHCFNFYRINVILSEEIQDYKPAGHEKKNTYICSFTILLQGIGNKELYFLHIYLSYH